MKLIKCIIRPSKIDDVREALEKASLSGMTITEVRGHGRQKGHKAIYRGREYRSQPPAEDHDRDGRAGRSRRRRHSHRILTTARTGDIGDGRIWVLNIDEGYNIRTAARDM